MCRLFVFNSAANVSADKALDAQKFKLGHVIEVLEDGQFGGVEVEGKNATGLFQIIEIPGVPAAKYYYLLRSDDAGLVQKDAYPRLRINVLDVTALKVQAPPDPTTGIIVAPSEKAVTDLVSEVTPVPIDAVVADTPLVIG